MINNKKVLKKYNTVILVLIVRNENDYRSPHPTFVLINTNELSDGVLLFQTYKTVCKRPLKSNKKVLKK